MDWNEIVKKITPYIVKIETPAGHGTGFLCLYNEERNSLGVATACHVVEYADQWQQPIRMTQPSTQSFAFLQEGERIIVFQCEFVPRWRQVVSIVWLSPFQACLPASTLFSRAAVGR